MRKLVSLIIPIYNAEKYLKTTMECILNQEYKDIEVVAVNDCSTDNSLQILNDYRTICSNAGIQYTIVDRKINGGLCAAINSGLEVAKGEYYCFPDADDELMPEYIGAMMEVLENNPDKQWVRCDYTIVLENENREYDVCLPIKSCYKNDYFDFISKYIPHNAWNMIVSKEYFKKCVGAQIHDSRLTQEWSLLLPLSYYLNYARCTDKLYRYHIRTGAMSSWQNEDIDSVIEHIDALEKLNLTVLDRINIQNTEELELSKKALKIYYYMMRNKKYVQHDLLEKAEQEKNKLFDTCSGVTKEPLPEFGENLDMYVRLVFDKILCGEMTQNISDYEKFGELLESGYEVYADKPGLKLLALTKKAYGDPVRVSMWDEEVETLVELPKVCLIENSMKYRKLTQGRDNQIYIDYRDLRNSIRGWVAKEEII